MPCARNKWLLLLWLLVLQLLINDETAQAQQSWQQSLRARGGLSYFQDQADSQLGMLYGLDLSVPMFEHTSLYGSFTHNHFNQGSQYLGTLGSYHQSVTEGDFFERFSGGLLFDLYTDTRFDGLYLSQFRNFLGYALSEQLAIGVTYTNPLEDADSVTVRLPGGGIGPATLQNAEVVEGYLSMQFDRGLLTAAIGQRQDPNDLVASLYATHQLSRQVGLFTNTSYADGNSWAATFGLQWTFGSRSGRRHHRYAAENLDSSIVVRAQNRGQRRNPYFDPSLGHNLNYDAQRFGSLITNRSGGSFASLSIDTINEQDPGAPIGHDQAIVPDKLPPADPDPTPVTGDKTGGPESENALFEPPYIVIDVDDIVLFPWLADGN